MRRSYRFDSSRYVSPAARMLMGVAIRPASSPVPSATMAAIAMKRLNVPFIVRKSTLRYVRFTCYHSILSTGTGSGFVSVLCTVPLLMWITRSAMAVSAVLCVMTMTVRPVWRQVSCNRRSTCLPVL